MALREYQKRSIDMTYDWMRSNKGNPCLVLPTGSGKSHIISAFCKGAIRRRPDTRIMMLTHKKELIEQNADKLVSSWATAPLGLYSSSMRRKEIAKITFAGIASVAKKAKLFGHVNVVIVDECHLINNSAEGMYRRFIGELREKNPKLRVLGLTATPYRLGQGSIITDESLFDGLIEPVSILELVEAGYLAPLRSKLTDIQIDMSGVKKRGGEWIEKDLQNRIADTVDSDLVAKEILRWSEGRKSWLVFCAGVDHSIEVRDALRDIGVRAESITGKTPKGQREKIISSFKSGRLTCITNANVLTTGFDAPNTDLIAMLRPTKSRALYMQMAGRGMRLKEHCQDCIVLDFAGNVKTHGAITETRVETGHSKSSKETIEAPTKVCPACQEIIATGYRTCPVCQHEFPIEEKQKEGLTLHNDDIMRTPIYAFNVKSWEWKYRKSQAGNPMYVITYTSTHLPIDTAKEYILADRYDTSAKIRRLTHGELPKWEELPKDFCKRANDMAHPVRVNYKTNGKYPNSVVEVFWDKEENKKKEIGDGSVLG